MVRIHVQKGVATQGHWARGLKFLHGTLYDQYTCHIKIEAQSEGKKIFGHPKRHLPNRHDHFQPMQWRENVLRTAQNFFGSKLTNNEWFSLKIGRLRVWSWVLIDLKYITIRSCKLFFPSVANKLENLSKYLWTVLQKIVKKIWNFKIFWSIYKICLQNKKIVYNETFAYLPFTPSLPTLNRTKKYRT